MRTLINRLEAEGVFDATAIDILTGAFDEAWRTLMSSGAPFAEERYRENARLIVAQHIIQLARLGERDKGSSPRARCLNYPAQD